MRYVWIWAGLAAFNALMGLAFVIAGEWRSAFTSFGFAIPDAYVASLLYDRERLHRAIRTAMTAT